MAFGSTSCFTADIRLLLLQAELQKDVERAKKLAEAEGRIKENRENEDVNRRAALLK